MLSCLKGLYWDVTNGINKGACRPLLIHADKSKTKEKEAEERVRQRSQETTAETSAVTTTATRYTVGLTDIPDVSVQTTGSGSMTQEIFMVYAKHFVSTLPPNHGPIILFLDSHGSCWNAHALQYLMSNKVFAFILASHTSIWSQPNDAGVNKRFHWAVEEECKKVRRTLNAPTIEYFNTNIANGWCLFLSSIKGGGGF